MPVIKLLMYKYYIHKMLINQVNILPRLWLKTIAVNIVRTVRTVRQSQILATLSRHTRRLYAVIK